MVTSNSISKMNRRRPSSVSSSFRLLERDHCDTVSSVSRNSIYKQKIDSMFDDSKSIISQRLDDRISLTDRRGSSSIRGGSVTGRSSVKADSASSIRQNGKQISNSVQEQIERMFTEVSKDATSCSFPVRCLGSLPLKDKVTSLQGLQEPLRQLYLSGAGHGNQNAGNLDICLTGLRVRLANGRDPISSPFHNIAVWSAVKFVVSSEAGGAAFLPLITDPENIDKTNLFFPLSAADKRRLSSGLHSPLFAVVMRASGVPKRLECHGFVCQTPEDAIVIAATLYQSLMAHMGNTQNPKTRRPRNRNGVSCVSIASSSATTNVVIRKPSLRKSSTHSSIHTPARPPRKKRSASSSLSAGSDSNQDILIETSTEERKKKSLKSKRAPPIPQTIPGKLSISGKPGEMLIASMSYLDEQSRARNKFQTSGTGETPYHGKDVAGGDILTRVAIPRSGSFLNTGGLSRYKSRGTRKVGGKSGGGGGSPLGFSELFNEFRLQENLHSLDEILNAIINSDGMSFNDLKPIYKEFLLKLAVTLTKDELYQRSKSIMRRQKKRKLRRKNSNAQNQRKKMIIGAKGLKRVFMFGKFRSKKSKKLSKMSNSSSESKKNKKNKTRTGTSGSDVSVIRNEHTFSGQNRNSSSGYVSCSECSYDSESCTCASADRCYCSLGAPHNVNRHLKKNRKNISAGNGAQDTLISCRTEDKCYCSLDEKDDGNSSDTTWCDSDSCVSTTKCYCQLGGNGRPVDAHEALSVKKSVEMAALFADVKLSQTTDITSLVPGKDSSNKRRGSNSSKLSLNTHNSNHSDLILRREMEKPLKRLSKSEEIYQPLSSQRPVSSSLEDSLGYLP